MTKKSAFLIVILIILSLRGISQMIENQEQILYEISDDTLKTKNGTVNFDLMIIFPKNYFEKKSMMEITPYLISDAGEEFQMQSLVFKGEKVKCSGLTANFKAWCYFNFSYTINYDERYKNSYLEIRSSIKKCEKEYSYLLKNVKVTDIIILDN